MKKTKKILLYACSFLLISFLGIGSIVKANDSYDYKYSGNLEYGHDVENKSTALFTLENQNNDTFKAYCINYDQTIVDGAKYSITNVDSAGYFSVENANKIRNIVMNSYPYISLKELEKKTNIANLTKEQAIAGTQAAIWYYSNNKTQNLSGNIKKLYNFYLSMKEKAAYKVKVSDIIINKDIKQVNGLYEVTFTFKAASKNINGKDITLNYSFDKDIESIYNAQISALKLDNNGYYKLTIKNIPTNAEFSINVFGKQDVGKDVFFYYPNGGLSYSQSLVGIMDDNVNVKKTEKVNLNDQKYKLTINKIDELTSKGISGVEFEISASANFQDPVYILKTDENGNAYQEGLSSGIWYIRETKTPQGYAKVTEPTKVIINKSNLEVTIKNSQLGKIKVLKVDEDGNKLGNVKFSLYKDSILTTDTLLLTDLTTNENGEVVISNLEAGTYTLVETATKNGYVLNEEPITVNVELNKQTEIKITNESIGYGKLKIFKRDIETNEQLGGAVIGIYLDSEFKNLYKEITTIKEGDLVVENIPSGKYYLKEIKNPDGYLLDSANQEIIVEKNSEMEVTFYNSKNFSTATNTALLFIVSISLLGLSIVSYIVIKLCHLKKSSM